MSAGGGRPSSLLGGPSAKLHGLIGFRVQGLSLRVEGLGFKV